MSRPQDRWPDRFSHPFWAEYPYFLPCLVAATYSLLSFVVNALYLKEVSFFMFQARSEVTFRKDVRLHSVDGAPGSKAQLRRGSG